MTVVGITMEEKFWTKVDRSGDCWIWRGGASGGRPVFAQIGPAGGGRQTIFAHRFAYEIEHGPLPEGMMVRRTCTEGRCVRHLEAVPKRRVGTQPTPATKRCRHCLVVKPAEDFPRKAQKVDGLESYCTPCNAALKRDCLLRSRFGITELDYQRMETAQGGCCASCGEVPASHNSRHERRPLVIDHDHRTGRVRGLLCTNCNVAIGHAKDDPDRLRMMALYLEGSMR